MSNIFSNTIDCLTTPIRESEAAKTVLYYATCAGSVLSESKSSYSDGCNEGLAGVCNDSDSDQCQAVDACYTGAACCVCYASWGCGILCLPLCMIAAGEKCYKTLSSNDNNVANNNNVPNEHNVARPEVKETPKERGNFNWTKKEKGTSPNASDRIAEERSREADQAQSVAI
jgi:hypothetical protein